jgi:hypothetical protein
VRKGAFWHFKKARIIAKNPAANGAFEIIDGSREPQNLSRNKCESKSAIKTNSSRNVHKSSV